MKFFTNNYMEHSQNKTGLCGVLGIMEFMNAPLKMLYLLIPIITYILALFNRDRLTLPLLPAAIQPVYALCINILLVTVCVLLEIAVVVTVGRRVHDEETKLFAEVFHNQQTYNQTIHLIYKRKRNGITIRKIYTHIEKGKWNERSADILQLFNAHFVDDRFQYAKGNSRIIIMKTADGIEKPVKTQWHDGALDQDMEEMGDVATRL
jgi:hypothetical protein